jgi:putative peptide zinc metalloprotease protein
MEPPPPKLRGDLVVSQQETPEGSFCVVKDPATGRFFRFREAEHFILQQLDGATPLDLIQRKAEEKFGASLPQETLERFTTRLRGVGLLEDERADRGHLGSPRGRVRGSPLYLRLKAVDPDRLFNRLLPRVRLFFTPHFVVFSGTLILLAFAITFANWREISRDVPSLFRFKILFLIWLTSFIVVTAHEFAHGLTCKRFGGEVHEMGFLLIYLQPAFYCNVSDAWLFPEKSRRLWVTFAGPYFELFLWAVATLIWRVTEPETALHYMALVVMTTSAITFWATIWRFPT